MSVVSLECKGLAKRGMTNVSEAGICTRPSYGTFGTSNDRLLQDDQSRSIIDRV